jgi:hypothetical protein
MQHRRWQHQVKAAYCMASKCGGSMLLLVCLLMPCK